MILGDIITAIAVGVVITLIFALGFRRLGPWQRVFVFFIVVMLAAWAGGVWASGAGARVGNIYWLPFLLFGLVAAVIIAATAPRTTIPPRSKREYVRRREYLRQKREEGQLVSAFDWFFIITLVILGIVIMLGYFVRIGRVAP